MAPAGGRGNEAKIQIKTIMLKIVVPARVECGSIPLANTAPSFELFRENLASACPLAPADDEGESPGQARRALVNVGTRLCAPPWLEHGYSSARV